MKRYLNYLIYVLRHKWFVFLACLDLGVPLWIAVFHDWDKLLPDEFIPYAKFFYEPDGTKTQRRSKTGYYKPTDTGNAAFDFAWLLHQKRNKHHWQWWVLPEDNGGVKVLPMTDTYRREMLADWRGAGKAQGTPDTKTWYLANHHKMKLHPETREWIERMLDVKGLEELR